MPCAMPCAMPCHDVPTSCDKSSIAGHESRTTNVMIVMDVSTRTLIDEAQASTCTSSLSLSNIILNQSQVAETLGRSEPFLSGVVADILNSHSLHKYYQKLLLISESERLDIDYRHSTLPFVFIGAHHVASVWNCTLRAAKGFLPCIANGVTHDRITNYPIRIQPKQAAATFDPWTLHQ